VLHRLLFIGRAISEPSVRDQVKRASAEALTAAVANNAEEFSATLTAPNADWVYVRFLPSREQIESVHRARKRAFIAGQTVSGNVPENWRQAADVGVDAVLTDYPLELRAAFRQGGR
jgi:glycerophosphoryl diester phosphodiesterase